MRRKVFSRATAYVLSAAVIATSINFPMPGVLANTPDDATAFEDTKVLGLSFENNLNDATNKHNVTVSTGGTAKYSDGVNGTKALNLDGTYYLDLGTDTDLQPSAFTVSFWLKAPSGGVIGDSQIVWFKQDGQWYADGWYMGVQNDRAVELSLGNGNNQPYKAYVTVDSATFFPEGEWVNVVVSYDSATKTAQIYRNGEQQGVSYEYDNEDGVVEGTDSGKWIGCNSPEYAGKSKFELDEVELYSSVATKEQAISLYTAKGGVVEDNEQEAVESEKLGAVKSYDLWDVDVTDTYMSNAEEIDIKNMLELDVDRLLAGFRETAGLDMLGKTRYGGNWENSLIGGHTLGHYMTALAQASVILPEGETKNAVDERLAYIIDSLKECQDASKGESGYIFGAELLGKTNVEFQFDNVELGLANITTQAWVPWYTMHKILAGLVDTYKLTGNETALTVAENLGRWVYNRSSKWSSATQSKVLGIEYGGMNDCLYELYAVSNAEDKDKFAIAAHKFDEDKLFENVALGTANILNNKHANTTVVKFLGALNRYVTLDGKTVDGSEVDASQYLEYAKAYFDMVVEKHSYVTGNSSEWEHFGMDNVLDAERTRSNCETCNAYNMLKLAKALFQITGDPKYSNYYETTFYNSILTAQDPETGLTTYWQPMATGYFKVYSSLDNHFWCCTGTGMEDFTKIGNAIYYNQDDTILVSEYISSVLTDNERNTIIEQVSDIPNKDTVKITIKAISEDQAVVDTLALRLPDWLASDVTILVNGSEADYEKKADYAFVSGLKAGDVIEMTLPMEIKAYNLPDGESEYAFMYGPIVLAAKLGKESMSTATDGVNVLVPAAKLISSDYISDGSETVSIINGTVEEFMANINENLVKTENQLQWTLENTDANLTFVPFYSLHGERYGIYFNYISNTGAFNSKKYINTKAADRDLVATYDTVQPGYGQYENDELHNMTDNGSTGFTGDGTGRCANADGSFSYRMKFNEGEDAYLQTYLLKSDNGKSLKISVGDTEVYAETLNYEGEEEMYMLRIPVSKEVLAEALYTITISENEVKVADVKVESSVAEEASAYICNFMYSMRAYSTDTSLELSAENATIKKNGNTISVNVESNVNSINLVSTLATAYGYEMINGMVVRENVPYTVDLSRNNYVDLEYTVYAENHKTTETYTVNIVKKNDLKTRKDIDTTVAYFVNCGDYDTTTLSEGDLFGVFNGVTEQVYGKDPVTGYTWGIVDTISNPLKNGTAANIPDGAYTDDTWPFETDKSLSDTSSKKSTNRYTKNQFENDIARNLNYSFELPNDTYTVELYFTDPWGCSKSPDVAAEGKNIISQASVNKAVSANVTVTDGKLDLNITSSSAAINLAYIIISSTHVTTTTVKATCTKNGYVTQTSKFGNITFTSKVSDIKATGHSYNVTYNWSNDGKSCTAVFKCKNGDVTKTQVCKVTSKVSKAATYKAKGTTTYTAVTTFNGKQYTSVKSVNNIAMKKLSKPVISSVTNTSKGISITWKKVTGATGYVIECKTGSGSWKKVKTINSANTLKYTHTSAKKNGTKYQYRVYAFAGSTSVNKSAVSATKTNYYLSAVTNLKAKNSASKKISVTWNKNSKASGYEIKYVTGSTTKTVKVAKGTTVKKTISSLKKSKTYKVAIRAYKKSGSNKYYSAWSKYVSVKISK